MSARERPQWSRQMSARRRWWLKKNTNNTRGAEKNEEWFPDVAYFSLLIYQMNVRFGVFAKFIYATLYMLGKYYVLPRVLVI